MGRYNNCTTGEGRREGLWVLLQVAQTESALRFAACVVVDRRQVIVYKFVHFWNARSGPIRSDNFSAVCPSFVRLANLLRVQLDSALASWSICARQRIDVDVASWPLIESRRRIFQSRQSALCLFYKTSQMLHSS